MADDFNTGAKLLRQCDISRHEAALARRTRVCEVCAATFVEKGRSAKQLARGQKQRFCSRACYRSIRSRYPDRAAAKRAEYQRAKERRPPPAWAANPRECCDCSAEFSPKAANTIRCDPCRTAKNGPRPKVTKPCAVCGTSITGTAAQRYCSACLRAKKRERARPSGRARKHIDRARRAGVAYEPIDPLKVFDRDAWRCQVCGVKTPRRLRGTYDARAPELDHRVPMAMGGDHVWSNVQCCCRACNGAKGGMVVAGQADLFPEMA